MARNVEEMLDKLVESSRGIDPREYLAPNDTARINWLARKLEVIIQAIPSREVWMVRIEGWATFTSPTLREAIDAAMAAEAGGQPADQQQHV